MQGCTRYFFDSFSHEKIAIEILEFTNHCEFVGLADTKNFKSLVQGILIEMASKSVYRNQIFSAIAFAMYSAELNHQNKFVKFIESDTGSSAYLPDDIPEMRIDFNQPKHIALNAFSNNGIIQSKENATVEYAVYHEIGHFLGFRAIFGDLEKSMAIAAIGRSLDATPENLEKVKAQWMEYVSYAVTPVPPEEYDSITEILKDPIKYNAYLFIPAYLFLVFLI